MAPPSLPRSLRRDADRRSPRGSPPSSDLLDAVRRRQLTRSNTKPGTAGRQAVDHVSYERRTSPLRHPGRSARELAGHENQDVRARRSISGFLADRPGLALVQSPTKGEASRLARYDNLVGQLASGKIKPEAFHRRVSKWQPVQGQRLESDPTKVMASLSALQAAGQATFMYASGRAG
jgi:hypothetical protein